MRSQMVSPDEYRPKALRGASLSESLLADGKTVRIPLTKGRHALVDMRDFPMIADWNWCATAQSGRSYARRGTNSGITITMHSVIKGRKWLDHKDGDGLNNKRSNLRKCNASQNQWNRGPTPGRKFKGAFLHKVIGKFYAHLCYKRKVFSKGPYVTVEEAASAYDKMAIKKFGKFARLNFPNGESKA